ncbi:LOW QUALITY PROTEIN: uncharacterized protein LOC114935112 [Nylanderia fulva]|uniref:LOW QUALITY PROTEIN: uncharacterized protein LOC114935112 n=1 Tax=Nylanderia fulva TaxID=613905 RepID=UPI0010FB6A51|nr:LOW QUALITY PROTEIN: uncharacterized protein LOC114935112 [Nylanderia fulva]
MGDKEHHVHFSGGSGGKDNNIMIQPQRHGHIDAHLGFLQLHHRYHIEFSIPWNTCTHAEKEKKEEVEVPPPAIIAENHNPNCHIVDLAQEKDVQIMCCSSGTPLKIVLNARVLAKDKGTPLLRNGIRSIAIEGVDEDEISE